MAMRYRLFKHCTAMQVFALLLVTAACVIAVSRGQTVWQEWLRCLPFLAGGGLLFAAAGRGREESFLLLGILAIAVVLQSLLGDPPGAILLFTALGGGTLAGTGLALFLRRMVRSHADGAKRITWLGVAGMAVTCGVLYLNGGLWVRAGGFSVQLSEFLKILMPVFAAGLLTWELPVRTRYGLFLAVTAANAVLLAGLSELGTAAVLVLTFFLTLLWAFPPVYAVGTAAAGTVGGLLLCRAAFFLAEQENLPRTAENLARKIVQRLTLFLHPEQADPLSDGYQQACAMNALLRGGSLGTVRPESIPVAASDYILAGCAGAMGCLFTVLLIAVLCLLYAALLRTAEQLPFDTARIFALVSWCELVAASLLPGAGSLGMIPMMGVAIPILSSGGTALLVTIAQVSAILTAQNFFRPVFYAGRHCPADPRKTKPVQRQQK